ncbi:MAG: aspartate kinase [Bacteroidia bacterium]|nr:aspartate kinase [Bacteroidia bacterium]
MIRKVYKFGGASVKDAPAVKNLAHIVSLHQHDDIMLVVSAMGKTTNMLEKALGEASASAGTPDKSILDDVVSYHYGIIDGLFGDCAGEVRTSVDALLGQLYAALCDKQEDYDLWYDQTVSFGELISTAIVSKYLSFCGIDTEWVDARKYVITDNTFRSATPYWDRTGQLIRGLNKEHVPGKIFITQGFIGGTADGQYTTTLGREGSDYTAAIFANCLEAEEVSIWKDVDGLLNADPKRFEGTVKIPHISYSEAIELSFYGATIIHPKTLKPLQNKNIALKVRSFLHPENEPTVIDGTEDSKRNAVQSYIVKDNQTLVSISPRDYSFMNEHNLQIIFAACDSLRIHANMLQTSALMFSFCFDADERKLKALVKSLSGRFSVKYNNGLSLFTVRHYSDVQTETEKKYLQGKQILIKQGSRSTLQYVLKSK